MNNQGSNLSEIVGRYGQSAIAIMKQIAEYLKVLQVERPELFVNGVLVEDWVQRLQDAPLPPEVLPNPEPVVYPNPVNLVTSPDIADVLQRVQKAMGEFGANAVDVMNKIAAFLVKLQVDRPDLFVDGVLVEDWSIRIQTKPAEPLILPIFDPDLIPDPAVPDVPVVIPDVPVEPVVTPPIPDAPTTSTPPATIDAAAIKYELGRIRSAVAALTSLVSGLEQKSYR